MRKILHEAIRDREFINSHPEVSIKPFSDLFFLKLIN